MSLVIAQFVVGAFEAYVLAGVAFALLFLPRGVDAAGSPSRRCAKDSAAVDPAGDSRVVAAVCLAVDRWCARTD